MEKEKCYCPYCHAEITLFVRDQIALSNRRKQMERAKKFISKERQEELSLASQARLSKWRKENPEKARQMGIAALRCRTAESFARQANTLRETAKKKSVKFAELLSMAKEAGREITPELEAELMELARKIITEENRAARAARKKAKKKAEKK